MQLEIYQWLVPLLSLFYIIRTIKQYSKGKYSPRNTVIWILFWLSIAMIAIMPDEIPNRIAKALGFKDHINAIIFVGLGILFLMVFYLSTALNRVEDKLTDLVRKLALEEAIQNDILRSNEQNSSSATPKQVKTTEAEITTPNDEDIPSPNNISLKQTGKTPKLS